jgi:hypothetical protein
MMPEDLTRIDILHMLLRLKRVDPDLFSECVNVLSMTDIDQFDIIANLFVTAPHTYYTLYDEQHPEKEIPDR